MRSVIVALLTHTLAAVVGAALCIAAFSAGLKEVGVRGWTSTGKQVICIPSD